MWHNKKSYFPVQMMLVALGILLWSLAVPYAVQAESWNEGLWWQQEIPPAGPNEIINPEYLIKREELAKARSQIHRQTNTTDQYKRWAVTRHSTTMRNDRRALYNLARLERELKRTPMYIKQGAQPAPGPEPAGEILLKY